MLVPDGPDAGTALDMGFIVFNDRTYPAFTRLLTQLGVTSRYSEMSFSFHSPKTNVEYAGTNLRSLFARPTSLFNPSHWRMLLDIIRFNRCALRDLQSSALEELTLGGYLATRGYGQGFRENYLLPMGAAIWSTPIKGMMGFPAAAFLQFFKNHGLLTIDDRPRWQTVLGGSHSYVKALENRWNCQVILGARIRKVFREPAVRILLEDGSGMHFDKVVIATHADEALILLGDPSLEESLWLGNWTYQKNLTCLHTDSSFMPRSRQAWASWNYRRDEDTGGGTALSVTYDMNRLQGLKTVRSYFVTLNPQKTIEDQCMISQVEFTHPVYTFESLKSQKELPRLNGLRNTYFCGSYFRFGFHEDAVQSALAVGKAFGAEL
jgi:predicted NAD/FAD-binding protein